MRELALFAGAGGGLLGSHLLRWRPVCAVEANPYCRLALLARQRDGCLPEFPIWDDVKTFDGTQWRGQVDIVTGGFPCQPFSTAAHGRHVAEDLWPEMLRIIGEVQPHYVLAENVKRAPILKAAEQLTELGYGAAIVHAPASVVAAPHGRSRWWAVAYPYDYEQSMGPEYAEASWVPALAGELWPEPGPEVLGVDDGIPHRMDRIRAIGNGQVPAVVAAVWRALT